MKTLTTTRPEAYLTSLRDRLFDLLSSLPLLSKPGLEQKAMRLLRKVEIARLLDNHYVVAITGFQGVGKTTLARAIYELPEGLLPEGVGRGEQLPVWILEDDRINDEELHAEIVELSLVPADMNDQKEYEGSFSFSTRKIDSHDLVHIARNPSDHHFLLKLYVPPRFFKGSSCSFLLLPGIEQKQTVWVELARHAVSCVDAALFVTDESWARASTEKALRDVEIVLKSTNIIYVLTKADQSKDRNRELAEVVMKSRNLTEEERDRIVITDPVPEADPDGDWRPRLLEALDKYAAIKKEARMRQIQHLYELLEEEVSQLAIEVKEELDRCNIKIEEENYQGVKSVIEELQKEINLLRKEYAVELRKALDSHSARAKKALESKIENKYKLHKFWDSLQGNSLKKRREFREWIEEAWEHPEGPSGPSLEHLHAVVLNRIVQPRLCRLNALVTDGVKAETTTRYELLGTFDTPESQDTNVFKGRRRHSFEVNDTVLRDLEILLKHDVQHQLSDNFKNSVRVLPVLALEAVRIGTILPGLFNLEEKTLGNPDTISKIGHEFNALRNSSSGILKGVALMLGLDYMPDKEFDLVKDMVSKVSGPSAATSFITPSIVGLVAVTLITLSTIKTINRLDLEHSERGNIAIDEIADRTHAQILTEFDRMMDLLLKHVEHCLANYFHLDKDYARVLRLNKAHKDIRETAYQLKKQITPLLMG
ncbi:MAG: hypothetical protein D6816_19105 [Bacteroidetes bacterium]|nr:MAG: hypothetical protein D6816_19105 [Bacteroidota bacterium]